MPRTNSIVYPAPVNNIVVSSEPGVHPAATARHWLSMGHYIFDTVTREPLTWFDSVGAPPGGELSTIIRPARNRTQPLEYEKGGSEFDLGQYRYVLLLFFLPFSSSCL
jgi:hypothetical protein